jgi:hypothetical protein
MKGLNMKAYRILINLLFILSLSGITSCGSPQYKSADDLLQQMNVDQETFSSMPICLQIKIYTYVGMNFLDRDHSVAIVPDWMDSIIDKQPLENVADCIHSEGLSRLQIFSKDPASREMVSLAILTLEYKAFQLHIFSNPNVQELLHATICTTDLNYSYDIVRKYYITLYKQLPSYFSIYSAEKGDQRMKAELCNT